jgi:hypothetical protein
MLGRPPSPCARADDRIGKLKRNGFPQPAPQCDPLAASARSFSSVEARRKFPMSGLRVRLHRIARGGRAFPGTVQRRVGLLSLRRNRNRSDHRPDPSRDGTNLRPVRGVAADVGSNRAASAAPLIRTRSVPLRARAAVDRSSSRSARSRPGVRAAAPVLEALGPLPAHCRHSG